MDLKAWDRLIKLRLGGPIPKAVALYLAVRRDHKTGRCDPSQERIAKDLELSEASVRRALKILEDPKHGAVVTRTFQRKKGRIVGTHYSFNPVSQNPSETPTIPSDRPHQNTVDGVTETPAIPSHSLPADRQVKEKGLEIKNNPEKKIQSDSPELAAFRQELLDFQNGFAPITTQGKAIANHKAIRSLFQLAAGDVGRCFAVHRFQQAEEWRRSRVDWCSVLKDFTATEVELTQPRNGNQPTARDRQAEYSRRSNARIQQLIREGLAERQHTAQKPTSRDIIQSSAEYLARKHNRPLPEARCQQCFDTGTIMVQDPNAEWSFAMREAACPSCTTK